MTRETITPDETSRRLGFSQQHVLQLVASGELEGERSEGSSDWRIAVDSIVAFEESRERAAKLFDDWSRSLDEMGAPLE